MNKIDHMVLEIVCHHGLVMGVGTTIGSIRYKMYQKGYSLSHQQISAACNRLYKVGLIKKNFIKYPQVREVNCPMTTYENHDEFCDSVRTRVTYLPAHKNILNNI